MIGIQAVCGKPHRSLRSINRALAGLLGTTPAALYERQRVLSEVGMLPVGERGPGKGVEANPDTVTALILARLGSDNYSTVGERTASLAKLRSERGRCSFTEKIKFGDALSSLLDPTTGRAERVREIHVSRLSDYAFIRYLNASGTSVRSVFGKAQNSVDIVGVLDGDTLEKIAALLTST